MTNPIKTSITIIIATLCSLLSACGSTEASRVLGEIEDYMYAHPDTPQRPHGHRFSHPQPHR
ncbi:hypothetical protein [uncultured Duncaniella sp.]|uniref:hypothetical protein n=1 Tax=uncultured Duncaniella sp. TaxID=2768039 RepID=UPI00272F4C45|nr:hypothetical protein [uncultured Duncaniella sp.]